ncbi:hypothetical protein ACGFI9_12240 [Micromonospora sp. NPDC048930]|uniref:hypothetical protein n=1 Tax=Micromonospora sp. NPDC048930 TaxID=3364261 RepID=UPI003714846B
MSPDVAALTERSTPAAARDRAQRIRKGLRDYLETVAEFALAWERHDWQVLGYDSWQAYLDGEFGADRLRVPEVHRTAAVTVLRQVGMSTRAIGTALGISKDTVAREVATVAAETDDLPTTVRSLDGRDRPATRPTPEPSPDEDLAAGRSLRFGSLEEMDTALAAAGPAPDEQVWIAAARRGIEAHALKTKASTRCSRSTRTGLTLTAGQAAEQHEATWCRKCWPPAPPTEEPCPRCATVTPVGDLPDTPPRWCPACRFMPPADYVTTSVTFGTLLPGDYIDRPYGPRRFVAWHQVVQVHFDAGVTVFTDHGENVPVHEDMAGDLAVTVRRPEGRTAAAISVVDCRACHSLVPAVVLYNGRCPACLTAGDHAQMLEEKLAAQDPKMAPGPERTLPAGLLRAGDLVWVGPEGWQPATSVEIGPMPPEPGGWRVQARTRTGVHTATAQRTWRWDELLQIRRPVPATEPAGEPVPTGPAAEAHDPRASREAGAEIRGSAPAGTPTESAAGVPTEPADGADTAFPHGAGDAAPAPAPSSASPDGGAGVTPDDGMLTVAEIGRLRAVFEYARAVLARHPQYVNTGRAIPHVLGREYVAGEVTPRPPRDYHKKPQQQPVVHVEVAWDRDGEIEISYRSERYVLSDIRIWAPGVDEALDVLCALGILPAQLSRQYAAGVQAGLRGGDAIDGELIEEDGRA